jgi:hypothetical protein
LGYKKFEENDKKNGSVQFLAALYMIYDNLNLHLKIGRDEKNRQVDGLEIKRNQPFGEKKLDQFR